MVRDVAKRETGLRLFDLKLRDTYAGLVWGEARGLGGVRLQRRDGLALWKNKNTPSTKMRKEFKINENTKASVCKRRF